MLTLAASTAAVFASAWLVVLVRRRRRRSPEEVERLRRLEVNRRGRMATGEILDLMEPEPGTSGARWVAYRYDAAGVTYQAAQDLSALPAVLALVKRRVGRTVSVKYDPRVPANSILACEEWSGVPRTENQTNSPAPSSAQVAENS
jgi:Protein of unknown function (DUF3592)